MKFIPKVNLAGERVYQEEDEYYAVTEVKVPLVIEEADIQPVKGHELMTLEEGYRVKSVYKVFTPTLLSAGKEGTNILPDRIFYKGIWFVVFKVEQWLDGLDDHCCAYIVSENGR
jgi:GTP:adenosylcobinamide-phosphate guanylyltransferase